MAKKNSRRDLYYVAEYIRATRNEIAIDDMAFAYAGKRAEDVGYIPRPSMWLGRVGNRYKLTRFIASVTRRIFRITAGAPFHAFEALRLATRLGGNITGIDLFSGQMVGLAFSERAVQIVRRSAIADAPNVWVIPPWVDASDHESTAVNLLQFSSLADIYKAFRLAIVATRRLASPGENSDWVLQCYTALRWFVARLALGKLQASFVVAEHYDRWAVLTDAVIRASKRDNPQSLDRQFVLVQHGTVGSLGGGQGSDLALNYRLTAVTKLYAYGPEAASIFRCDLFTPGCARRLEVVFFKPKVTLDIRKHPTRPSILFVGHPLCALVQMEIFERIKSFDAVIYYKPHPIAGLPDACSLREWTIVKEPGKFPRVDLLISYQSTLVEEYSVAGITAVLHPMLLEECDVADTVEKIQKELKLLPKMRGDSS